MVHLPQQAIEDCVQDEASQVQNLYQIYCDFAAEAFLVFGVGMRLFLLLQVAVMFAHVQQQQHRQHQAEDLLGEIVPVAAVHVLDFHAFW